MVHVFNPAILVWSIIGAIMLISFSVNAYLKFKSYQNRIKHIFIDGDTVVVVSTEDEAPMGSVSLEILEVNHLAA